MRARDGNECVIHSEGWTLDSHSYSPDWLRFDSQNSSDVEHPWLRPEDSVGHTTHVAETLRETQRICPHKRCPQILMDGIYPNADDLIADLQFLAAF